jgi:hypothetical protein
MVMASGTCRTGGTALPSRYGNQLRCPPPHDAGVLHAYGRHTAASHQDLSVAHNRRLSLLLPSTRFIA